MERREENDGSVAISSRRGRRSFVAEIVGVAAVTAAAREAIIDIAVNVVVNEGHDVSLLCGPSPRLLEALNVSESSIEATKLK